MFAITTDTDDFELQTEVPHLIQSPDLDIIAVQGPALKQGFVKRRHPGRTEHLNSTSFKRA